MHKSVFDFTSIFILVRDKICDSKLTAAFKTFKMFEYFS